jgi:putative heme-binding domain-containing protein
MMNLWLATALFGVVANGGESDDKPATPVVVWAVSPLEVGVVFDRPLSEAEAASLVAAVIEFDSPTRLVDRSAPGGKLRVASAERRDEGKTIVLATDPHPWRTSYRLDLSAVGPSVARGGETYSLGGAETVWEPDEPGPGEEPAVSGWWPQPDLTWIDYLAGRSPEHARAAARLSRAGRLTIRTQLFVVDSIPGNRVPLPQDYKRHFYLTTKGGLALEEVVLAGEILRIDPDSGKALLEIPVGEAPTDVEIAIRTGLDAKGDRPAIDLWQVDPADPRFLMACSVPWAPAPTPVAKDATQTSAERDLEGGNAERGEAIFFGQEGKCADCHAFRGRGKQVGPDLSDIAKHDAASIHRAIVEPSADIHPNYVPFTVALSDGRVLAGTVRSEGTGSLRVVDTAAKETVVSRTDVTEIRPTATSIMPVGLAGVLGPEKLRDLIAYLRSTAMPEAGK